LPQAIIFPERTRSSLCYTNAATAIKTTTKGTIIRSVNGLSSAVADHTAMIGRNQCHGYLNQ